MVSAHPALFRCIPLGCTLTREACGARHLRSRRPGERCVTRLLAASCRECGIGEAHARGERPDVPLVRLKAQVAAA